MSLKNIERKTFDDFTRRIIREMQIIGFQRFDFAFHHLLTPIDVPFKMDRIVNAFEGGKSIIDFSDDVANFVKWLHAAFRTNRSDATSIVNPIVDQASAVGLPTEKTGAGFAL